MNLPRSPPYQATHPDHRPPKPAISGGVIAAIVITAILITAALIVFRVCLRARKLGLPAPTWRTFVPFLRAPTPSYEPTRPAQGGVFGFFKRSGYTGAAGRSARTRGAFGDEQAWDVRMEDEEMEYRGATGGAAGAVASVLPRGREQDLGAGMESERGRSRSRAGDSEPYRYPVQEEHAGSGRNPFSVDMDAHRKKDGFGDTSIRGGRVSVDIERRSVFREGI